MLCESCGAHKSQETYFYTIRCVTLPIVYIATPRAINDRCCVSKRGGFMGAERLGAVGLTDKKSMLRGTRDYLATA